MIAQQFKLKNSVKYPTSLIFGGLSKLGLEIVDALLEQGGYVVIVDTYSESNLSKLQVFPKDSLVSFIDYTTLPNLDEELRRLDYVFFFNHEGKDLSSKVSTQEFLKTSNYIDTTLSLSNKFDAKFLLTTSIKAHQINAYNEDFKELHAETHKTYTESEVQRHAESLVMEYIEKNDLDARIVRLAEIIGDGIDFSLQTQFNQLVLSAAKGESLKLQKDGLESEWLVHILDAAYGIIKAQFSKNTKGKIFSISYENSFTHLAIAYKLQEEEPAAQEIEFLDEKDNLPSLKLYKPAINLSSIGWSSKILFDKALKQSIAAAKIYLLESSKSNPEKKGGVAGKLFNFFSLAEETTSNKVSQSDKEYDGPISRLIAERRKQEELKQQSIELASSNIKLKKRRKSRTFKEKVNNWAWERFLSIGNSFAVFKNKTPAEFMLMVGGFLVFTFLFFSLVSPVLVFARNFLMASTEYNGLVSTIKDSNWTNNSYNFEALKNGLEENVQILNGLNPLFNVLALENQNTEVKKLFTNYAQILDGMQDINFALAPVGEYLRSYQGNLQLRTSTESYLSVTNTGVDYENLLLDFHDKLPYLQKGIEKYSKAIQDIRKINVALVPEFIQEDVTDINLQLYSLEDDINSLKNLEYLEDNLGVYSPKTYLILLHDNSRLKSIGGELAAFALLTIKNGSVIEVTVKSPEETSFKFDSIDDRKLKEINASKFALKTKENLNIQDLSSLINFTTYSEYISAVFRDTFSREIDGVVSINYNLLEKLLADLKDEDQIKISNINFSDSELLADLNSIQDLNAGLDFKHKISAQLLSNILYKYFTDPNKFFSKIIAIVGKSSDSKDLLISMQNSKYNKYVKINNYDQENIVNSDSYIKIGYNIEDNKVINIDKYPELNIAKEVIVNPEYKITNIVTIEFPLLGSSQEVVACIPSRVSNSSIKITNIPVERTTINDTQFEKCIVVRSITERQVQIQWNIDLGSTSELKVLDFGIAKVNGTTSSLDYKVTLDDLLTLIDSEPFIKAQGQNLIFTSFLDKDQHLELELQR